MSLFDIFYIKFKNGEIVNTYMRIEVNGKIPSVGSKGVIILFADGSKIEKPDVKINVEVDNIERGYLYTATFILNQEEIEKLTQKSITDVRLHIFDKEIIDGLKLQEYLKCISTL